MKNNMKIFWFMKFYTKLWLTQKHCVLDSTKLIYLLELGARYLVLFRPEKYAAINKMIRYLICQKIGVT